MPTPPKEEEVILAELEARLAEAKLRTFEAREKLAHHKAQAVANRENKQIRISVPRIGNAAE